MDHGRDAPDQHCDKNGSTFCDLSHQIGRKGTAGLFLLVNDRLRFTCYAASRTMTGVCRPPLETGGLRTLAPLPGGQRPSAHAGVGRRRAGRRGAPLRGGCRDARTHPRRPSARPPGSQPRRSPPPASSCAGSPSPPGPPPVPSCGRAASVSRRSGGRPGAGAVERGETCAGRFALLAHVLVGVVAERSVWTHGGRHRDVIPSSGTGLERGMYVAGPRNIHLQQPAAPEHGPGGGAGGTGKPAPSGAALSPRGSGATSPWK